MTVTRRNLFAGAAAVAVSTHAQAQGTTTFDQALRTANFSGAALVTKNGATLHRAAYGNANHENGIGNTPETRFLIASITKTMTAGAVLKLAGQGHIDLDAPVSRYIDAPQAWEQIRVSQLMNHSSGLPDIVRQPGFRDRVARRTSLEETAAYIRTLPLDFAPGSQVAYGNSGSAIAARIIELVSGLSYPVYLRDEIYAPLGLADSGFADSREVIPHLASGYRFNAGVLNRADYLDMTVPLGAGSQYSTVDDLAAWIVALEANRLAPHALTRRMFTPSAGGYGMAWHIEPFEDRRSVTHMGDINGFVGYVLRLPDQDITVVVLGNIERIPAKQLAETLARTAVAA